MKSWPAEGTVSARKAAHNRGSRVSGASTGASLHTVSRAGVAAASRLRRPEARHATTAENETATTGGGIGLRSGGFGPSRSPPARAPILGGSPACLGLAASILSLLRRSDRRVRPLPGRRGAQPPLRPRGSFRLDRSAPAHPSACLGLDRSGSGARCCVYTQQTELRRPPARGSGTKRFPRMRGDRPAMLESAPTAKEVPPHGAGIGRCTRAKWPETGDGKQSGNAKRRTGRGRYFRPYRRPGGVRARRFLSRTAATVPRRLLQLATAPGARRGEGERRAWPDAESRPGPPSCERLPSIAAPWPNARPTLPSGDLTARPCGRMRHERARLALESPGRPGG